MHLFFLELIFLPFIGFFLGILSMLYGIGGGIIIVPTVFLFLRNLGFDAGTAMEISIGTSMLSIFASTFTASYWHYKDGNILWPVIRQFSPFIIIGALTGIFFAHYFPGEILRKVFIGFLIFTLIYSLFDKNFKTPWRLTDFQLPPLAATGALGTFAGMLSVLVGVGGGTLILPFLRHYRMPMLQGTAITTSITPILALIGSVGYFFMHLHHTPPYTYGAINFPIFVCLFIGSWLGVQFGGNISKQFTEVWRARTFPIVIGFILTLMLV